MKVDPPGPVQELDTELAAPARPVSESGPDEGQVTAGVTACDSGEAPEASSLEVRMSKSARTQKLAEVRQRVESGAYNTRDMIERVVDRLLDKWNLPSPGKSNRTPQA